jgi:hypothetical protein
MDLSNLLTITIGLDGKICNLSIFWSNLLTIMIGLDGKTCNLSIFLVVNFFMFMSGNKMNIKLI